MMVDSHADRLIETARELARRARIPELAAAGELSAVADGGSDRRFFRLEGAGRTAVVLSQPGGGWEVDSYVELARFLARFPVGVPEIYGVDARHGMILMEDLGDLHLEDALGTASPNEAAAWYRGALDVLVELETSATSAMDREGLLGGKIFDMETLLGETDYFLREFIEGFCPVRISDLWEEERRLLAGTLAREPRVFMHRDYQSRNIMLKDGRLRIVDFQTAHRGPGLYDAASLLKDAYHPVSPAARRTFLEEFHAKLKERGSRRGEPFAPFYEIFTLAGIQRTLQALAAFAKLGVRKGKTRFLDSIPNGIDLLEEGIRESGRFPGLAEMTKAIRAHLPETREKGLS